MKKRLYLILFVLLSLCRSSDSFYGAFPQNHPTQLPWTRLHSSAVVETEKSIGGLLDEAILLYHGTVLLGSQSSSSSWMTDQLSSLALYLATRLYDMQEGRTSRQVALELEQAMVRGEPLPVVEELAVEFRELLAKSSCVDGEIGVVSNQLAAFESLLPRPRRSPLTRNGTLLANDKFISGKSLSVSSSESDAGDVASSTESHFKGGKSDDDTLVLTSTTGLSAKSKASSTELPFVGDKVDSDKPDPSPTTALSAKNDVLPTDLPFVADKSDNDKPDRSPTTALSTKSDSPSEAPVEEVDIAIVGAGLAGLCAGAILNTCYGKKVGIYESHYLPGGCAHAFDRKASNGVTFTFDSGPSILLGCSSPPFNALQQVLETVGQPVEWIPYDGWGMIEKPGTPDELRWKVQLGPDHFEEGPLAKFGGEKALDEFNALRKMTKGLLAGASIPAMAMRAGSTALVPLLRYFPTLVDLISQGETLTGTFGPFMDGPLYTVTDPWLRNWLDALAFSLSGLPASRTAAAAMAFVLSDMHRPGAALDYPRGGMGAIIDGLVRGVEQGDNGSAVNLRCQVASIDASHDASRITGLTLTDGRRIRAREGVICNAPVWSLNNLIKDERVKATLNNALNPPVRKPNLSWQANTDSRSSIRLERPTAFDDDKDSLLAKCDTAEMTGSFLHLHLALDAKGLDLDSLEAHYTVMDRSLAGDKSSTPLEDGSVPDGPCGELNMIAVSNPCKLDRSLAPEGYIVMHAYGAGNEPFELWKDLDPKSAEYKALKEERAQVLWRAVESVVPDVRKRVVLQLIGSPLTHQRFLRRPQGSYGSATEDYLPDGSTPYKSLVLASDGVFPGIGVPSVAIAGASAANTMVTVFKQWQCLDTLKRKKKL